jgi:hypothetical protein
MKKTKKELKEIEDRYMNYIIKLEQEKSNQYQELLRECIKDEQKTSK